MSDERKAFLEHEANRNVDTWGYLLGEALDDNDRLRAENKRLWRALIGEGWHMKCSECWHEPAEHDVWNRCTLDDCACRRYCTSAIPVDLPA